MAHARVAAILVALAAHCGALRVSPAPLVRVVAAPRAHARCAAPSTLAPSGGRVRLPTLATADFQHPEDAAATASLRSFWPIELAIRSLILPVLEVRPPCARQPGRAPS